MKKIYDSILELIGETPIIKLNKYGKSNGLKANIFAKLEKFNPAGSSKDRIAFSMIESAEKEGKIKSGATIIEPTSGNTGIGLAMVCAYKGYKLILTMPDTMSVERINLIKAYGAEVVLTEGKLGMKGSIEKAEELNKNIEGSLIMSQFTNPANPKAHREITGKEIYEAMDGKIDYMVISVGSGGTMTGIGEYLKSKDKNIKLIAVEPKSSNILNGGKVGAHKIQGIGANFIPQNLNTKIYDEVIDVADEDAYKTGKELALTEGVLCGISSGATLFAGKKIAERKEAENKNIVVFLADNGERYLSVKDYLI